MEELIKVQRELVVPKGRKQQNIQYRNTEDILKAVKRVMPEHCFLTMSDEIHNVGNRNYISAVATFSNGKETIQSIGHAWEPEKLASMSMPQITGSCSSYARKTALCGLFMIDDSKDVDSFTDAEKGTGSRSKMATPQQIDDLTAIAVELENSTAPKDKKFRDGCTRAVSDGITYANAAEMIRSYRNA